MEQESLLSFGQPKLVDHRQLTFLSPSKRREQSTKATRNMSVVCLHQLIPTELRYIQYP